MPSPSRDHSAPLERGLAMLQCLAQADGLSFGEILDRLGAPKASVARLLRVLRRSEYVRKDEDTGRYHLGPSMAVFARQDSVPERLAGLAGPILRDLRERTGNTILLSCWTDRGMQAIAKEMHPASVSMRAVSQISPDLSDCPWGWLFYHSFDTAQKAEARKAMPHPGRFQKAFREHAAYIQAHGFAYDDQQKLANVRRLAVPVMDADGRTVAVLALGGNPLTVADDKVTAFGAQLLEAAHALRARMGWSV